MTGLVLMRTLRRFAHRLDPAVEFAPLTIEPASKQANNRATLTPVAWVVEQLGDELVERGAAVGGGDVADEDGGAGAAGLELARRLAERGGVGADQHDDVHVRTTNTADTARERHADEQGRERPPTAPASSPRRSPRSRAPGTTCCAATIRSTGLRLLDAAPKQLHGRRSFRTHPSHEHDGEDRERRQREVARPRGVDDEQQHRQHQLVHGQRERHDERDPRVVAELPPVPVRAPARTASSFPTPETTRINATTTRAASATSSAVMSLVVHALVPALEEQEGPRAFAHVEVEHATRR